VQRLVKKVLSFLPKNGKVCILGLSYKPETNVIEESQSVEIAKELSEKGIPVIAFDPQAMENAKRVLNKVSFANSLKEAVEQADLVLITVPWKEFKNIPPDWLKDGAILFDCWRILDSEKYKGGVKYIALGIGWYEK
jgi:UDPglucose 6-dehydrogenase